MDAVLHTAAGFGCYSVALSVLNACCVRSCWKTEHHAGPCELRVGFHHKTKGKVEKQANITSFLQQDIASGSPGKDGWRQIYVIHANCSLSLFIFLETGTENSSRTIPSYYYF